jgi:hypothetical protein
MIIQGIAKSASVFLAALVCAVAIAGVRRGAAQDQSPPPPQDQSRPDQAPVDAAPFAEKEYYANAHAYTAKFISTSDEHDGLYWKSMNDVARSPIGPYLAHAGVESDGGGAEPFHGYYYRILLRASEGFAIVAYPATYRSSGVMTFIMNSDGIAYENDLGEQTSTAARQISSVHSNDSWKKVE